MQYICTCIPYCIYTVSTPCTVFLMCWQKNHATIWLLEKSRTLLFCVNDLLQSWTNFGILWPLSKVIEDNDSGWIDVDMAMGRGLRIPNNCTPKIDCILKTPNFPTRITRTVHKVLMREVLSDRYRIIQEKFQYHGVLMWLTFRVFTLYN